jgi:diguanylate cyclase (GGDEF)-like protein/PAS domain S-box-containing protein
VTKLPRDVRRAVEDSEARTEAIFDVLDEGLIAWTADGRVLRCNPSAARIVGVPKDELERTTFADFIATAEREWDPVYADGSPRPRETFPAVAAERTQHEVVGDVVGIRRTDGTRRWLEIDVRHVDDPVDGNLLVTCFRDVTQQKEGQDRMRVLSAIVDSSSDAITSGSIAGTIESWNDGAQALYGYTADEMIGRSLEVIVPADAELELEHLLLAVRGGKSINNLLTTSLHKDGTRVPVALTASPIRDADGEIKSIAVIARGVRELVAARDALIEAEERFRSLVQRSSDVAFVFDSGGVITYASPAVTRYGYQVEDIVGRSGFDFIHPDDLEYGRTKLWRSVERHEPASVEWRLRAADGTWHWVEETVTDLSDVPAVGGLVANIRDITDRREAERRRRDAEERFRQGFERSAFGLAVLDLQQNATAVNPAVAELLGYPVEALLGRKPVEFIHPTESDRAAFGIERLLDPDAPPYYKREHRMIRADGTVAWVIIDMTVVRDADGEPGYYFVQLRDITDRKRAEEALEHQALHDDLTRLPNRLLLVDRLSQSLARAERTGGNVTVLFLDLDRFKLINDGLGHVAGDQLLMEVASRLAGAMRTSDTVARFGGDEFVIIREDVRDETEALEFAERIAVTLNEPITVQGRELYTTTSIGIAIEGPGASAEQLLRDADAAMYRAKDLGRARIELFSHELQQRVAERLDLGTALRRAIERDELRLLFQPIVRLSDGRVVGAEALLRWHREGYGLVPPDQFIPVAEETGLIVPIGAWALEHALSELRSLTDAYSERAEWPLVSVNLSALQLRLPASIDMVRSAIQQSDVDPAMLSLEITESALMDDIETSTRAMRSLRELGVRFAVDDFGTGYSSLAYLKQLPIDSLKIDRSFIDGLPHEAHDRSITEAIITIGRTLGLTIVAEGVESVEQWIALDELGCSVGQGFLWSPPVPAEEFAPLLRADFDGLRAPSRRSGSGRRGGRRTVG